MTGRAAQSAVTLAPDHRRACSRPTAWPGVWEFPARRNPAATPAAPHARPGRGSAQGARRAPSPQGVSEVITVSLTSDVFPCILKKSASSGPGWLGGWAHRPTKLEGAGSVHGQGVSLRHGSGGAQRACERQPIQASFPHRCSSPSLSPSLPPFLESIKEKIRYNK